MGTRVFQLANSLLEFTDTGCRGVDPAIHNSNTRKFRGGRLAVPSTEDHRFPEELALEAVRQFTEDRGQVPTADQWAAAGLSPSEKTIRRRFGSFRAAARLAGGF
jgi:hypothetical protein